MINWKAHENGNLHLHIWQYCQTGVFIFIYLFIISQLGHHGKLKCIPIYEIWTNISEGGLYQNVEELNFVLLTVQERWWEKLPTAVST